MLMMAFILAVISTIIEMFFVVQYEAFRNFMLKHVKFGLFFSLALSISLGEIFGAHGLIALMGGLTSTIFTFVIYETGALSLVDRYRENQDVIRTKVKDVLDTSLKTIVLLWKIVTAPVRFGKWCKLKYDASVNTYRNMKARLSFHR